MSYKAIYIYIFISGENSFQAQMALQYENFLPFGYWFDKKECIIGNVMRHVVWAYFEDDTPGSTMEKTCIELQLNGKFHTLMKLKFNDLNVGYQVKVIVTDDKLENVKSDCN